MKIARTLLLLVFILSVSLSVKAQVLFTENFSYTLGDSLGAHGWMWNTGTVNTLMVVSPGLTYSGYLQSGIGYSTRLANNGNDAYKSFTVPDSVTSGSLYCAFMVKVDSAKAAGDYFFAFLPSSSTGLYTARTYVKDSTGSLSFGISKGTAATGQGYGANTFTYGSTLLVVVKYTFNAATTTDDVVSLYVFSSGVPLTEPTTPYVGPITSTATDITGLGRVAIRQGSTASAPSLNIDGFSVGRSWASIFSATGTGNTNITTPSSYKLLQNYPNPFNPVTRIVFEIPNSENVSLKVFDMLGKEVSTLVNSKLQTGRYEYSFDGKNLNSGVYFYKLTAGNFTDTKSFVLIK